MSTSDPTVDTTESTAAEQPRLEIDIQVDSPEACLRHVVVTIPKTEIERYRRDAFNELVPDAQVPGFRAGRAPRKLVEKAFRERVEERVKNSLLMDSLAQVTEDADFSPISEPDFEYESIELPEDGDFKYEFRVEVRPEFETPNWRGLELERPTEAITDEDVDVAIRRLLGRNIQPEPIDEAAAEGDLLLITAKFSVDGKVVSEMEEERVRLSERVTFSDANCANFGELMTGVREGETRNGKVVVGDEAEDESLRGKEVDAEFHVVEVSRKNLPQLTPSYLMELGDFESEGEFREFVRGNLDRQISYREQQALRQQIVEQLTGDANWELPPDLVRRQTRRELERKVLEMRSAGFDEEIIRRYVNVLSQNAKASTIASLREHFILEQIAEDEKIDAEASDYDDEIKLIAEQSEMTERRVRARLEKTGQMDALRNQIIERKVIEMIKAEAKVTDVAVDKNDDSEKEFAVFHSVLGAKETDSIPEAKYDDKGAPSEDDKDKK